MPSRLWASRYDTVWQTPVLIQNDESDVRHPQVAMDRAGNAVVVWQESEGFRYDIWFKRYSVTSGNWGTSALLETDDTADAENAQLAMDDAGNAVVVWQQSDGTRSNIWVRRLPAP